MIISINFHISSAASLKSRWLIPWPFSQEIINYFMFSIPFSCCTMITNYTLSSEGNKITFNTANCSSKAYYDSFWAYIVSNFDGYCIGRSVLWCCDLKEYCYILHRIIRMNGWAYVYVFFHFNDENLKWDERQLEE